MTGCRFALIASLVLASHAADAQEIGPIEGFGADGRLYGPDRYLLSRQSYRGEHTAGYEGQFRIVKRYEGGGYEVEIFDFMAQCAPGDVDPAMVLTTFPSGSRDRVLASVTINADKRPPASLMNAYNLFFAACHLQFQKFR